MDILKDIYPSLSCKSNCRDFEWLRTDTKTGKQEFDIFLFNQDMTFTLAVEYDGQQHFEPVCFGGISIEEATILFKKTQAYDTLKNAKVAAHPNEIKYFIRFNYTEIDSFTRAYVSKRLVEANIPIVL
jgi:hypothetical protein